MKGARGRLRAALPHSRLLAPGAEGTTPIRTAHTRLRVPRRMGSVQRCCTVSPPSPLALRQNTQGARASPGDVWPLCIHGGGAAATCAVTATPPLVHAHCLAAGAAAVVQGASAAASADSSIPPQMCVVVDVCGDTAWGVICHATSRCRADLPAGACHKCASKRCAMPAAAHDQT